VYKVIPQAGEGVRCGCAVELVKSHSLAANTTMATDNVIACEISLLVAVPVFTI
jgi:hypothetical protein